MVTKKTSKKKAKIVYNEPKNKKDYLFPVILVVVALVIVGIVTNGMFFFDKIGNRTYFYIDEISIFYSLIKYNSITGLYFIVYYKIIFCSIKI